MPVTAGSATKVNKIPGLAKILNVTADETTTYADYKFESGILVKFANGKLYLTDATKKLSELTPVVDQVLTEAEKTALATALSTGNYVAAANGVVVHGADGKIADGSLNVVSGTKITTSYLADFVEEENGVQKIKLDALPATVKGKINYVADITARDALTAAQKSESLVFVIDASADATVDAGAAMYGWDATNSKWVKIAEVESLDVAITDIVTHDSVETTGAVMYDHTVLLESPTMTELVGLNFGANAGA